MQYEWDEAKSESNRKSRGFAFAIIQDFQWYLALGPDVQFVDHEERLAYIGPIASELYVIVVCERDDAVRVISMRVASNAEKKRWRNEFYDT